MLLSRDQRRVDSSNIPPKNIWIARFTLILCVVPNIFRHGQPQRAVLPWGQIRDIISFSNFIWTESSGHKFTSQTLLFFTEIWCSGFYIIVWQKDDKYTQKWRFKKIHSLFLPAVSGTWSFGTPFLLLLLLVSCGVSDFFFIYFFEFFLEESFY